MVRVADSLKISVFVLAVTASACHTAAKRTDGLGTGLPSGKVTAQVIENLVPLETQFAYAPRRFQEMENAILLNKDVQECLRNAPDIRENTFSVGLEGHLSYSGAVEHFVPETSSESFGTCLTRAFKTINFLRGRMGPFKLQVVRGKPPEGDGKKPKGILLDLNGLKKWE